mmetsp:Transcript_12905/g.14819  ORF Transcript_12905/g.14819 Transcript_12905/m.14819 type:complete len:273 (+) Transcript_12905:233-1051(+)
MGGGDEQYPSAATVNRLLEEARSLEVSGDIDGAIKKYRDASRLLLLLASSNAITADEKLALTMQSKDLDEKAEGLLKSHSPKIDMNTDSTKTTSSTQSEQPRTSEKVGATAVGATAGLAAGSLIGMPLLGFASGAVAGALTSRMEGETGDKARNVGRYGATAIDATADLNKKYNISGNAKVAAESAYIRAVDLNRKHDISGNVSRAVGGAYTTAKEMNEKHDISGKAKRAADSTVATASRLNQKYKVTERVSNAISSSFSSLTKSSGGGVRT